MHVQSQQCGVQTRDLAWPSYCLGKKQSYFHEADKEFEQPQGILRPLGHGLLITCFWVKINYGVPQTRMIHLDCLLLSQHSPWRRDNWKLFPWVTCFLCLLSSVSHLFPLRCSENMSVHGDPPLLSDISRNICRDPVSHVLLLGSGSGALAFVFDCVVTLLCGRFIGISSTPY